MTRVVAHTVLLDTCVVINLAATDRLDDIARRLDITFQLTRQAAAEVGHLRDIIDGEFVHTRIDLDAHAGIGTLQIIDLAPFEYSLYIELAKIVDDGEASTIAVAAARLHSLATDDRKARRLCAERQLPEPTRTLALIRRYVEAGGLSHSAVRDLLVKIRERASFLPPRGDPDYKWWLDHIIGP